MKNCDTKLFKVKSTNNLLTGDHLNVELYKMKKYDNFFVRRNGEGSSQNTIEEYAVRSGKISTFVEVSKHIKWCFH